MARDRGTKQIAQRVDFSYLKQRQPLLVARRWLWIGAVLAVAVWFLFAGVRWDLDRPRIVGMLYNPGPVSDAHAVFETSCTDCHTGDGQGGFTRAVTDQACLKCHDGAIHHTNQAIGDFAVEDSKHPHQMRSSDCKTCHVEHRGRAALAATSDQHCLVCHENLMAPRHAREEPRVQARITGFAPQTHPPFGRSLQREQGKLFDPTALKFNHAVHQMQVKAPPGMDNCVLCHQNTEPAIRPNGMPDRKPSDPPYPSLKDRLKPYANSSDRRYIQPVNYEVHCAQCHPLKLSSGVPVLLAHEEFEIVSAQLANLPNLLRTQLAAMSDEERSKALTKPAKTAAPSGRRDRRSGSTTTAATAPAEKMSEQEWIDQQSQKLREEVSTWFDKPRNELPGFAALQASTTQPTTQPGVADPHREYFAFYRSGSGVNGCMKCHESNGGEVPSLTAAKPGATVLATLPTGVPSAPRRWFAASQFDHDAHRNLNCVDCHAAAKTSQLTEDVLLPGMTTTLGKAGQSCVGCHQPVGPAQRTAPGGCVTCHLFHDRTLERSPDGPATQPASPASLPAS